MRKTMIVILLTVFAMALLVPAALACDPPPPPPDDPPVVVECTKQADLMAGQYMDAGDILVGNDGEFLTVIFEAADPWKIIETHLCVADNLGLIPQTKNGNPIPGKFAYIGVHDLEGSVEYKVPMVWAPGTTLYIAAHAVVIDTSSVETVSVESRAGVDVWGPLYSDAPDSFGPLAPEAVEWTPMVAAVETWKHPSWPLISGSDAKWIATAYYTELPRVDSWRWFRDELTLPEDAYPISGSVVTATSDNAEQFFANGVFVGSDGEVWGPFVDNHEWGTLVSYPFSPVPGSNTLDFIVRNYRYPTDSPTVNPTGLIYKAEASYYDVEETAWGFCADNGGAFSGANWATYLTYTVGQPVYHLDITSVNGYTGYTHWYEITYCPYTGALSGVGGGVAGTETISNIVLDLVVMKLSFKAVYTNNYTWYPSFTLNADGTLTFVEGYGSDNVTSATGTWEVIWEY